ncbi:MAG: stress response translation initiation inhibitor YciH, partial [Pseudomonadales bacterium]
MKQRRIVYSTNSGRHCPDCGAPADACQCKREPTKDRATSDGVVRLQRQTRGRAGKPVVIITGLPLSPDEMKLLASKLKAKCGVG